MASKLNYVWVQPKMVCNGYNQLPAASSDHYNIIFIDGGYISFVNGGYIHQMTDDQQRVVKRAIKDDKWQNLEFNILPGHYEDIVDLNPSVEGVRSLTEIKTERTPTDPTAYKSLLNYGKY